MTNNNQFFDLMTGGTIYRIDAGDGALTAKAYDRIYVAVDVILTTLTGSDDSNLLTAINCVSDTDTLQAGLIFGAGEGLTFKAITVKSGDTGVVYGITFPSTSV